MPRSYDEQTKAKAVRLVIEHQDGYPSQSAAIAMVAKRLGVGPESLRRWVRQYEVNAGAREGVSSEHLALIRELKRKNAELEQTVEILKAAASFFARESDPRQR